MNSATSSNNKSGSPAGTWLRRALLGLCLAVTLAACTSEPDESSAPDTPTSTTAATVEAQAEASPLDSTIPPTADEVQAALARSARDDVAVELPQPTFSAAAGETISIPASVFGVLGEAGDGVLIRPQINFLAAPGLTPTNLPSECDPLAGGAVECIFDSQEKWFLGGIGDPARTETQTWTVDYTVDGSASGTIELEVVATSTDNPVSNDPDGSNNTGIITVEVG